MSHRSTTAMMFALFLMALLSAHAAAAADKGANETALAREILEATGVRGGLVVHLGCAGGRLTAALAAGDGYLVHGLDADRKNVEAARKHIQAAGLYGAVCVDVLRGHTLPYIENLVNLVVSEDPGGVPVEEIMRVLAPGGTAYLKSGGKWTKTVKPRPAEMDEWTHYLRDSTNNAVSRDSLIGPPRHLQWVGSPRWSRHHDHMASMSALVSTQGRAFYIIDEGPTAAVILPPKWQLIARDAFNGTVLWKRNIDTWNTHLWPLKSGPNQVPRRLVALGQRVYVTLGLEEPLSILDAVTGETVRTVEDTRTTEEIILSDGTLFLLVNPGPVKWKDYRPKATYVWDNSGRANREWAWDASPRQVVAVEADTGKTLWRADSAVAPLTLAASATGVFFYDGEKVVCLDRKTGRPRWTSEPVVRKAPFPTGYGPTLVLHADVVLLSIENKSMTALSASDGKTLWTAPHHRGGHASPDDTLVIGGLVWSGDIADGGGSGTFTGRDVRTGEVKAEFQPDVKTYWFHHRCYRAKATEKYILASRTGIEFIDLAARHWTINHWVRGGCLYGVMPANGMVYAPPHSCGCYLESKLFGLNALAPASPSRQVPREVPDDGRLERGPAFAAAANAPAPGPQDWPTYRNDAARTGGTAQPVTGNVKLSWQVDVGGRLSSLTAAGGRVFVASIDRHTLHALDAGTGKTLWTFTAGGRIDSPPTVHGGRVFFGSADGWVYALQAPDGQLAWRFRAAPIDWRHVAFEQVESPWPVHGSVLVAGGAVWCVAGRSMFLDGGLRLLKLDPQTGAKLGETILDDRDPDTGEDLQTHIKGLDMPVALPDILSCDGKYMYMRAQRFDLDGRRMGVAPGSVNDQEGDGVHLFTRSGFLDDTYFHRSYWMYGRNASSGWGGWFTAGRLVPAGRLMVMDEESIYGFERKPEYLCNSTVAEYYLYGAAREVSQESIRRVTAVTNRINAGGAKKNNASADWGARKPYALTELSATRFAWARGNPPIQARAMVLAGKTLFMAGPPDLADEEAAFHNPDDPAVQAALKAQADAIDGRKGGQLWVFSAEDGSRLAACELASPPVFDGMIAAGGRLFVATMDGKVLCLGAEGDALPPATGQEPVPLDTSLKPLPKETAAAASDVPAASSDSTGEFAHVSGAQVAKCDLGYSVRVPGKGTGVALKQLDTPITGKAVLKFRMKSVPDASDKFIRNGFLVFGNTDDEARLMKCGLRLLQKKACIYDGPVSDTKGATADCPVDMDAVHELAVMVDLPAGRVTMSVGGKETVSAAIPARIKRVTYVGYAAMNAVTEFSPVEIAAP